MPAPRQVTLQGPSLPLSLMRGGECRHAITFAVCPGVQALRPHPTQTELLKAVCLANSTSQNMIRECGDIEGCAACNNINAHSPRQFTCCPPEPIELPLAKINFSQVVGTAVVIPVLHANGPNVGPCIAIEKRILNLPSRAHEEITQLHKLSSPVCHLKPTKWLARTGRKHQSLTG